MLPFCNHIPVILLPHRFLPSLTILYFVRVFYSIHHNVLIIHLLILFLMLPLFYLLFLMCFHLLPNLASLYLEYASDTQLILHISHCLHLFVPLQFLILAFLCLISLHQTHILAILYFEHMKYSLIFYIQTHCFLKLVLLLLFLLKLLDMLPFYIHNLVIQLIHRFLPSLTIQNFVRVFYSIHHNVLIIHLLILSLMLQVFCFHLLYLIFAHLLPNFAIHILQYLIDILSNHYICYYLNLSLYFQFLAINLMFLLFHHHIFLLAILCFERVFDN